MIGVLKIHAQPSNDNFTNAASLTGSPLSFGGILDLATKETGEPGLGGDAHTGRALGKSLWWSWVAPVSGTVTLSSSGSTFNPLMGVFTGSALTNLSVVASNGVTVPPNGGLFTTWVPPSTLTFHADAGVMYALMVDQASSQVVVPPPVLQANISLKLNSLRIISPDENATFLSVSNVLLAATFAPGSYDGAVTKVDFIVSGQSYPSNVLAATNLGFVTQPPYQIVWTNPPSGDYSVAVKAMLADGTTNMSSARSFRVFPSFLTNDSFSGRQLLTGTNPTVLATNVFASAELGEPLLSDGWGRTLWYSWIAPTNGTVFVSVGSTNYTPIVGVFTGTNLQSLSLVCSNLFRWSYGSACPGQWRERGAFAFDASAGVEYQIAVDGYLRTNYGPYVLVLGGANSGSTSFPCSVVSNTAEFPLQLEFHASPANDNLADAEVLIGSQLVLTNSNIGATKEPAEPNHAGDVGGRSVWFTWTAPAAGNVIIGTNIPVYHQPPTNGVIPLTGGVRSTNFSGSTGGQGYNCNQCGTGVDANPPPDFLPLFAVYSGSVISNFTSVASGTEARFDVAAGQTFKIAMDGNMGSSGDVVFFLTLTPIPPNDDFSNARVLTGNAVLATGYNVAASTEAGEPAHAGDTSGQSVWWSWTAPTYGTVSLSLSNSDFVFPLAVYTGSDVGSLHPIAAGYGSASYFAHAGQVYQIAVGSELGNSGEIRLNLFGPPLRTNAFVYAQPVSNRFLLGFAGTSGQTAILQLGQGNAWTNLATGMVSNSVVEFLVERDPTLPPPSYRVMLIDEGLPPASPAHNQSAIGPGGTFQTRITGIAGQQFVIQASTNLVDWTSLGTNTLTADWLDYVDLSSTNFPVRFYRVLSAP